MRIHLWLLLGIILIAAFLRLHQLGTIPPSLTWDEAAWGYNAYTLGIDGKDEFGRVLPITYLESFGDFKPVLYAYLAIVPIKLLGLSEFATRLPSALFGILTVLLTYYLVKEIFKDKESEKKAEYIGLLSSFILAISPWHILLSRAAFEANVATFFIVLGVYLFLKAVRISRFLLIFSLISFVFSMYTFNTARIVSPLLCIVLFGMHFRVLLKSKLLVIVACLISFLIFIPLFFFMFTPQSKLRFQEVNIFTDANVVTRANQEIKNDNNALWSKAIHNRRLQYGIEYFRHYFDNLGPRFLFINGDGNPKFSIQDVGEMYIWEIPFLVIGALLLFRNRVGRWWIIPLWLIVGIIPAATARETPHALRIEATIPMFQIICAYGIYSVLSNDFLKRKLFNISFSKIVIVCLFIFGLYNFTYFIHNYFSHYSREYSGQWQYGYKDAIAYIMSVEQDYDEVQFTQKLGRPYAYMLFYTQFNPEEFRKSAQVTREVLGFVHVNGFAKYKFPEKIDSSINNGEKVLYIDDPSLVPKDALVRKEFKLLNGQTSLVAYTK